MKLCLKTHNIHLNAAVKGRTETVCPSGTWCERKGELEAQWPYSTVRKYNELYPRFPWIESHDWLRYVGMASIRLGSVTMKPKNRFAGAKLVVGTDSWSQKTGPSRMLFIHTQGSCRLFPRIQANILAISTMSERDHNSIPFWNRWRHKTA